MARTYTQFTDSETQGLLNLLVDSKTSPEHYQALMFKLGIKLGDLILSFIENPQDSVYLACTVEDADFLAKGIFKILEPQIDQLSLACFWNQRFSPFEIEELKVAPILKQYQEPLQSTKVQYLIIVKSIISGACVVRTNLTNLIQKIEPEKIWIVAPVIYETAEAKLKNEFDPEIYEKFQFFYFAKDDQRNQQGIVLPGIGGNVYERLGFESQEAKNSYVPELVKARRSKLVQRI